MSAHVARGSRGSIVYPEGSYNARPLSGSFGADPRGSAASVISNRSTGRPRRASVSAPRPSTRGHSPPPVSRHLDAYNARLEAHSSSPTSRPRRGSIYAPSTSHNARHGDPRASAPTFLHSERRGSSPSGRRSSHEEPRKGSTRFPRKFVNRDAVEEAGLPFEEDRESGAITVFKAMSKSQIDDLIERTALIRLTKERRNGGGPPRRSESRTRHGHGDPRASSDRHGGHGDPRASSDRHGGHGGHGDPRASSDRHVAFAPTKTIITHEDSRPGSSGGIPAGRGPSHSEHRAIEKNLSELERKAAAANEARIRAEEVAKMVHEEDAGIGGRRRGRDIVVVR